HALGKDGPRASPSPRRGEGWGEGDTASPEPSLFQHELHAYMGRGKSEPLVESMGVLAARAGGELDPLAAAFLRDRDRPDNHRLADAGIAPVAAHAHRLDHHALGPEVVEAGDEGELHGRSEERRVGEERVARRRWSRCWVTSGE